MNYKTYISQDPDAAPVYLRIDDDGVIRQSCSAEDPAFQEWLAEGNEPLPADD